MTQKQSSKPKPLALRLVQAREFVDRLKYRLVIAGLQVV